MSKTLRDIIEIDEDLCDGCGDCITVCAEGALEIVNGKARLKEEVLCDGAGACLGHCPTGALRVIKRESDEYDEAAVRRNLASSQPSQPTPLPVHAAGGPMAAGHSGCPGSAMRQFGPPKRQPALQETGPDIPVTARRSRLAQWPVQLMLIPPTAPFLQDADLLLAADCVPFAFADFHDRFLRERPLLIGCPKLDNLQHYLEKLTEMFRQNRVRSLEVLKMEVPCCGGIAQAAIMARQQAGADFPLKVTTFSVQGEILETYQL
jgi:NAD-dependent dihydropyrimidine dehydrogenase PreA subunit